MEYSQKDHEKEREEQLKEGSIKIILLGECGVGKTSLIKAYLNQKLNPNEESNGAIPVVKNMNIISTKYKSFNISLWDTAGQERFHSLTSNFYKGSHIVIFVYNIVTKISFEKLKEYWVQSVIDKIGKDVIIGLIANKADLFYEEEVPKEEGVKYAKEIEAEFRYTSAKENRNDLQLYITELIEKLLHKENYLIKEEKIFLNKEEKGKTQKKCCF
jgi:small GTP-binding protein